MIFQNLKLSQKMKKYRDDKKEKWLLLPSEEPILFGQSQASHTHLIQVVDEFVHSVEPWNWNHLQKDGH